MIVQVLVLAILASILVFFLVLLISNLIFAERNLMKKRMDTLITTGNKEYAIVKQSQQRKRKKTRYFKHLGNNLEMSGILIRPSEFFLLWLVLALIPAAIFYLISQNVIISSIILGAGIMFPPFYVHHKRVKRIELFEQQLIEAMGIMSSCLKSGLTFQQALVSVASEMPDPISEEFTRVVREMNLGSTLENSLNRLADKLHIQSFNMIVSAILIQRQTGGNLSEILTNVSGTIKDRYKIKKDIKVLTASARTSGMVVGLLPVVVILILLIMNPDYVTIFLETNLGIGMVVTGIVLELIGYLSIRKIVNIRF